MTIAVMKIVVNYYSLQKCWNSFEKSVILCFGDLVDLYQETKTKFIQKLKNENDEYNENKN